MNITCVFCGNCGKIFSAMITKYMDKEDHDQISNYIAQGFKVEILDKDNVRLDCSCGNVKPPEKGK